MTHSPSTRYCLSVVSSSRRHSTWSSRSQDQSLQSLPSGRHAGKYLENIGSRKMLYCCSVQTMYVSTNALWPYQFELGQRTFLGNVQCSYCFADSCELKQTMVWQCRLDKLEACTPCPQYITCVSQCVSILRVWCAHAANSQNYFMQSSFMKIWTLEI